MGFALKTQGVALVVLHKFWLALAEPGALGFGSEDLPAEGNVMQPLQAQPDRLRARLILTLPVHVTAQLCHQPNHLLKPRWFLGRLLALHHPVHRLPLRRLEYRLTTDLRATPSQPADVQDPPGHDQVYRQARQQAVQRSNRRSSTRQPDFSVRKKISIIQRGSNIEQSKRT